MDRKQKILECFTIGLSNLKDKYSLKFGHIPRHTYGTDSAHELRTEIETDVKMFHRRLNTQNPWNKSRKSAKVSSIQFG